MFSLWQKNTLAREVILQLSTSANLPRVQFNNETFFGYNNCQFHNDAGNINTIFTSN